MATTYQGNVEFEQKKITAPSKNEFGVDVLHQPWQGAATKLSAFLRSLNVGDLADDTAYVTPGTISAIIGSTGFYLQSWTTDDDLVFPTVTLHFKGVHPQSVGQIHRTLSRTTQTLTVSTNEDATYNGALVNATRDIQYEAGQTVFKWISESTDDQPDVTQYNPVDPRIINSVVTATVTGTGETKRFSNGNVPNAILEPLLVYPADIVINPSATEILGTPYWERELTVARLFVDVQP